MKRLLAAVADLLCILALTSMGTFLVLALHYTGK